jgi:hypothetical protein
MSCKYFQELILEDNLIWKSRLKEDFPSETPFTLNHQLAVQVASEPVRSNVSIYFHHYRIKTVIFNRRQPKITVLPPPENMVDLIDLEFRNSIILVWNAIGVVVKSLMAAVAFPLHELQVNVYVKPYLQHRAEHRPMVFTTLGRIITDLTLHTQIHYPFLHVMPCETLHEPSRWSLVGSMNSWLMFVGLTLLNTPLFMADLASVAMSAFGRALIWVAGSFDFNTPLLGWVENLGINVTFLAYQFVIAFAPCILYYLGCIETIIQCAPYLASVVWLPFFQLIWIAIVYFAVQERILWHLHHQSLDETPSNAVSSGDLVTPHSAWMTFLRGGIQLIQFVVAGIYALWICLAGLAL